MHNNMNWKNEKNFEDFKDIAQLNSSHWSRQIRSQPGDIKKKESEINVEKLNKHIGK